MTTQQLELLTTLSLQGLNFIVIEMRDVELVLEKITFEPLEESATAPINFSVVEGYWINKFIDSGVAYHDARVLLNNYNSMKDASKFFKMKIKISNHHKWTIIGS